ncbi:MAG: hypothetical protein KDA35_07660 [Hyphomonadaceae bacterium]|nr:hypothetical protein [Hyphomonadaceae bacterium]
MLIRLLSGTMALAVVALGFMAGAYSQTPPNDDVVHAKGEMNDPRLRQTWYETEGEWRGIWTPTHPSDADGAFTASWRLRRQTEGATLQVRVSDQIAIITRTQPNGQHCTYRGTFNTARTIVSGNYTCDWARTPMPWRASVGSNIPASTNDQPSFSNSLIYLAAPWRETEGSWHGTWTPVNPENPDGHFAAHWAHDRESARADLFVTVESGTGRVQVHRTDPSGRTCDYAGQIAGDFLTVNGSYHCSDRPNDALPWSAQLLLRRQ